MRVLLDECVPLRLAGHLTGHDVSSVSQIGWAGIKNGELLALASSSFDAFITVDYKMCHHHDFSKLPLRILVIFGRSNQYKHLVPHVPRLLEMLQEETAVGLYQLRE